MSINSVAGMRVFTAVVQADSPAACSVLPRSIMDSVDHSAEKCEVVDLRRMVLGWRFSHLAIEDARDIALRGRIVEQRPKDSHAIPGVCKLEAVSSLG